jgi:hypothetical protein
VAGESVAAAAAAGGGLGRPGRVYSSWRTCFLVVANAWCIFTARSQGENRSAHLGKPCVVATRALKTGPQ